MQELSDIHLQKTEDVPPSPPPESGRPPAAWIAAAVLIGVAAVAAYLYFGSRRPLPETSGGQTGVPSAAADARRRPGGEAQAIDVPPLGETDPLVRKLVGALSAHPRVAAWLATDDLVRNFVVVVENIAHGTTPTQHLDVFRPRSAFRVLTRNGELFTDPRNYDGYTEIADAVSSIDPQGAAQVYGTLKPRFEEAYKELGRDDSFDQAFERAMLVMLRTPVREGDVRLSLGPAVGYEYADPALEQLSPPQKQLLRMGPRNERAIQAKLRQIGLALGVRSLNE